MHTNGTFILFLYEYLDDKSTESGGTLALSAVVLLKVGGLNIAVGTVSFSGMNHATYTIWFHNLDNRCETWLKSHTDM